MQSQDELEINNEYQDPYEVECALRYQDTEIERAKDQIHTYEQEFLSDQNIWHQNNEYDETSEVMVDFEDFI